MQEFTAKHFSPYNGQVLNRLSCKIVNCGHVKFPMNMCLFVFPYNKKNNIMTITSLRTYFVRCGFSSQILLTSLLLAVPIANNGDSNSGRQ